MSWKRSEWLRARNVRRSLHHDTAASGDCTPAECIDDPCCRRTVSLCLVTGPFGSTMAAFLSARIRGLRIYRERRRWQSHDTMSNHDAPRVILSAFADEAANQKTAVQQFAASRRAGPAILQHPLHRRRRGHQERHEADAQRDSADPPSGRRVRAERGVDRLADRQGQAGRRRRRHEERLRAVQEVPGKGRQEGLRAGPRLRDQADPRLFVLSAQGRRSAASICRKPSISSARSPKRAIART